MNIYRLILLTGICLLVFVVPIRSQEISDLYTDSLSVDSFAIDSFDPDPEWYVAPIHYDSVIAHHAPHRVKAVASCPIDSILTYDIDSNLVSVTVYEYGDTTRTITWTVKADGSRIGQSWEESATTATLAYSATYNWDNTTNNWKGVTKTENVFNEANKNTSNTTFTWFNNAWIPDTRYTYDYNAAGLEIEYIKYTRNANNQLVPAQRRVREYNVAGKITLDLQYGNYVNEAWVPASQLIYDYDAAGNQILKENYTSYSNGNWVGSTREVWEYNAKKSKTLYTKQTWKNGEWSNSSKEVYEYNAANKQTLKVVYTGSGTVWTESTKEETDYNEAGNKIFSAKYNWKNGAWVGNGSRTQSVYNNGKLSFIVYSKWDNNTADWVYSSRRSYLYDGAGRTIGDTTKNYTNSEWVNASLVTHAYDAKDNDTLAVTSAWNGAEWVASSITKGTYRYTDFDQPLLVEVYTGTEGNWKGTHKYEWTYNEAELQTLYIAYGWSGGKWQFKQKNEKEYDDANHMVLNQSLKWENSAWVGVDKYEYAYDANGYQSMYAVYTWAGGWKGVTRTDKTMDDAGVEQSSISYKWDNNTWEYMFKYDYVYDEAGRTLEKRILRYLNDDWENDQMFAYAFDGRGQEISAAEYYWINQDWQIVSRREKTFDEEDNKIRREMSGSWNTNGVATSFVNKLYSYGCDPRFYTIRFVNYDGTLLETQTLDKGVTPSYSGAEPTRESNAEYTYAFSGWSPEIVPVTGDATYTATYTATKKTYTITWKNDDGSEISHETLEYGATPAHTDINKENTAEWAYTFAGWEPEVVAVVGDATYTAMFDSTKNSYTITWLNDDGFEIDHETLEYGAMPAHTDINKENTAEWTYTFAGWEPEIVAVVGDASYTAKFDSTKNSYTITFYSGYGTILEQMTVEYGQIPVCRYTPSLISDDFHHYDIFTGWTPEIVPATCDASYTPTFELVTRQYTITFRNYNGKELQSSKVDYGTMPEYTGETPERIGSYPYSYIFTGWDPELVPVSGDAVYKAIFEKVMNTYHIVFYDEDGITELDQKEVEYGKVPSTSVVPTKEDDDEYTYTFVGWQPKPVAATKDASYKASYKATLKTQGINGTEVGETATKVIIDNQIFIRRGGKTYAIDGQQVQ